MLKKLVVLCIVPFLVNAKIYKYPIAETLPSCVESGGYFENGGIAIGFSCTAAINEKYPELTESEYIDYIKTLNLYKDKSPMTAAQKENWANSLLIDKKKQYREIVDVVPTPVGVFLGKTIHTKEDVTKAANAKLSADIRELIGDNDTISSKIKLINNVLVLVLAMQGTITYEQANIDGIGSAASASAYIQGLYNSLWSKRNDYEQQAKQFILETGMP